MFLTITLPPPTRASPLRFRQLNPLRSRNDIPSTVPVTAPPFILRFLPRRFICLTSRSVQSIPTCLGASPFLSDGTYVPSTILASGPKFSMRNPISSTLTSLIENISFSLIGLGFFSSEELSPKILVRLVVNPSSTRFICASFTFACDTLNPSPVNSPSIENPAMMLPARKNVSTFDLSVSAGMTGAPSSMSTSSRTSVLNGLRCIFPILMSAGTDSFSFAVTLFATNVWTRGDCNVMNAAPMRTAIVTRTILMI